MNVLNETHLIQAVVCLGSARKREHRDVPSGTRRTGTEVHLERPQANAGAAGSVEQALCPESELARTREELLQEKMARMVEEMARKEAEWRAELLQEKMGRKDEEMARKEAERKWLPTIKPTLWVFAFKKAGIALFL